MVNFEYRSDAPSEYRGAHPTKTPGKGTEEENVQIDLWRHAQETLRDVEACHRAVLDRFDALRVGVRQSQLLGPRGEPSTAVSAPDEERMAVVSSLHAVWPCRLKAAELVEPLELPESFERLPSGSETCNQPLLRVPPPLRAHWARQTCHSVRNSSRMSHTPSSSYYRSSIASANTHMTPGGMPSATPSATPSVSTPGLLKLEDRWRDLHAFNESRAEEEDEEEMAHKVDSQHRKSRVSAKLSVLGDAVAEALPQVKRIGVLHPHSLRRVTWDIIGLNLVVYDVLSIPVMFAWDVPLSRSGPAFAMLLITLVFWGMDMVVGFNTGFFQDGTLILSRRRICLNYCRSWLAFDMLLVAMDLSVVLVEQGDGHFVGRSTRALGLLRQVRGLRLLKMSKLSLTAEDIFSSYGQQGVMLVAAVVKTLFGIFLVCHFLACCWYTIGRSYLDSKPCWIDIAGPGFTSKSVSVQYWRSYYWVLGHLVAAPVDATITPQNSLEMGFTIAMIMCSLLVLGAGISKMSSTIAELNQMSTETNDTKRELQRYLKASGAPAELSVRVIRFVLHAQKRHRALVLNPLLRSLLSTALESELTVNHRKRFLMVHPLFALIADTHPQVLFEICGAFKAIAFSERDNVFWAGTWSQQLVITVRGAYMLARSSETRMRKGGHTAKMVSMMPPQEAKRVFDEPCCFAEIALFAQIMHYATLTALTFADAFTLSSTDLVQCVRQLPSCAAIIHSYGCIYLSKVWDGSAGAVPEGMHIADDVMPAELAHETCRLVVEQGFRKHLEIDIEVMTAPDPDSARTTTRTAHESVVEFLLYEDGPSEPAELLDAVAAAFPELDPDVGIYAQLSLHDERKRAVAAIVSALWLLRNRHDRFATLQPPEGRMSEGQWGEWQQFLRWTGLTGDASRALLVFLAIRGLGKAPALARKLPRDERSPENIVMHLVRREPALLPSVRYLNAETNDLIESAFRVHAKFNLAQFLQTENTPNQILELKRRVRYEGEALLKFYLLAVVCTMCGLKGADGPGALNGSLFMDEQNGRTVLQGIQCLQQLDSASPQAIYWGYLCSRACRLGLPVDTAEQLATARLACLTRCMASQSDLDAVHAATLGLSLAERAILVDHLCADGVQEPAFLFAFLPQYLVNGRENPCVGLQRSLVVLVDIVGVLHSEGFARSDRTTTAVNLSDLAAFGREVRSPAVFEAAVRHLRLAVAGPEFAVMVSVAAKHWQRASASTWRDDAEHETVRMLRTIDRRTENASRQLFAALPEASAFRLNGDKRT